MTARSDALRVLREWRPPDAHQRALRDAFVDHLVREPEGLLRVVDGQHLTASCLVLDADRLRCLLTLHAKVGRWLQTGGHIEAGDGSLVDAAAREAREETGIDALVVSDQPVQLDRHAVQCDGRLLDHLDVQYVAIAPAGAREVMSAESSALRWYDLDALPPDADDAVRSLVRRARASFGAGLGELSDGTRHP